MIVFNKIFGIGLGKTGLHSLTSALNILGIKALQNWKGVDKNIDALFSQYKVDDIKVLKEPCLKAYDAFISCGDPRAVVLPHHVYKQLDKEYPNSKFILTIRDLDSWLISTQRHIERNRRNPYYKGKALIFNKNKLIKQWEVHNQGVLNYFKDRLHDLLVMDICGGEGWEKLCSFLELPVPYILFPHINRTEECRAIAKI